MKNLFSWIFKDSSSEKLKRAHSLSTPPEALERLSTDEHSYVRWDVADNPNTPPEVLERLSNDKDLVVRWRVEYNPNTPQYIKDLFKFNTYLKYYE